MPSGVTNLQCLYDKVTGFCRVFPRKLRIRVSSHCLISKSFLPMYVKNVSGSSRFPKPKGYDSWLEYWKAHTRLNPYYCSADNCLGTDLVGAHVQKAYSDDKSWYIVPLCSSCNKRTDSFNVNAKLVPVPSNL